MSFRRKIVAAQTPALVQLWSYFVGFLQENQIAFKVILFLSIVYMHKKVIGHLELS